MAKETIKVGKKKAVRLARKEGHKANKLAQRRASAAAKLDVKSGFGKGLRAQPLSGPVARRRARAAAKEAAAREAAAAAAAAAAVEEEGATDGNAVLEGDAKGQAAELPQPEDEEEREVDEEDVQFFEEHAPYSSFLANLDAGSLAETKGPTSKKSLKKQRRAERLKKHEAADEEEEGQEADHQTSKRRRKAGNDESAPTLEQIERSARRASTSGWDQQEEEARQQQQRRLPVKMPDGRVQFAPSRQPEPRTTEQEEEDEDQSEVDQDLEEDEGAAERMEEDEAEEDDELLVDDGFGESIAAPPSAHDLQVPLRQRLQQKKVELAVLCEELLESPDCHVLPNKEHPRGWSKLAVLFDMVRHDPDPTVRNLAMISAMAVFRDVLPAYRIRLPTAAELAQRVSREVKLTRQFEAALLTAYQAFLKHLDAVVKSGAARWAEPHQRQAAEHAAKCLGQLLVRAPQFNFASNILKLLCERAGTPLPVLRQPCVDALRRLFRTDQEGTVSLEAVKLIAKQLKDGRYPAPADVLGAFTALPLRIHEDDRTADGALRPPPDKHGKKRGRGGRGVAAVPTQGSVDEADAIEQDIQAGLEEAKAVVDPTVVRRAQRETLAEIVLAYFRVLQLHRQNADAARVLLPAALSGLAKFAPLINFDTVSDLLGELKELLQSDELGVEAGLTCVKTALHVLTAPVGKDLQVDDAAFSSALFRLLGRLAGGAGSSSSVPGLVLECLDVALVRRKEYSVLRVAAFVRRLALVALHLNEPALGAALMAAVRLMLLRYPTVQQLLENDEDRAVSGGAPLPLQVEPERCNPLASACWELALLGSHWHPTTSAQARAAAAMAPTNPRDAPTRVLNTTGRAALFHPTWPTPKPHPLQAKRDRLEKAANHVGPDQKRSRRQRQQQRQLRRPLFLDLDPLARPLKVLPTQPAFHGDGDSGAFRDLWAEHRRFDLERELHQHKRVAAAYQEWSAARGRGEKRRRG